MYNATFTSLCQFCGFNCNAKCPARVTITFRTTVPISVSHPCRRLSQDISANQQGQVSRGYHAEVKISSLASNYNGSRYSHERDQCATITKFASLGFTSFVDLVSQTVVHQQILAIHHQSEPDTQKEHAVSTILNPRSDLDSPHSVLYITDRPSTRDSTENARGTVPVTTSTCLRGSVGIVVN